MKEIKRKVLIEGDVEAVFTVLTALHRRPDWVTTAVQAYDLPAGPLRSGQRFRQRMRVIGRPVESEWFVVQIDPPCRIVYESVCPTGGYLSMTQNLTSTGEAATVEIVVQYELPGELLRGQLGVDYIERRIQREVAVSLHNLRDLVEERSAR